MKKSSQFRIEKDSLGQVKVPKDCLWGAHTQRALEHFSIGEELIPKEMILAYAIEKKASALVNREKGQLSKEKMTFICQACDEILAGKWSDQFPVHIWVSGSGTQWNMNINEVLANRCSQLAHQPLGSKHPVHPNDDVNMSQSTNDSFPAVMHMAVALSVKKQLIPILEQLKKSIQNKANAWKNIVKLGRTHLQDATPLTLGQEFSGYASMLSEDLTSIKQTLKAIYQLTLGGTAVGTGLNTWKGFDQAVAKKIAELTGLPFVTSKNKFAAQGAHNALVQFSATLKTLAVSLYKIANDIRLLSCGPRSGFYELILPANEPGSSIMPGKINPTQCEALCMVAIQVMANDFAVAFGGAGGHLEMNVYKPLIIYNLLCSIRLLRDSCDNFDRFLIKGMQPNLTRIQENVNRSLMLATALTPVIGYDKAAEIAHYALDHNLTLREATLQLRYLTAERFDQIVQPLSMCYPLKSTQKPA